MSDLKIAKDVLEELNRARSKFPRFNSPHEGYAVLLEEVDELWDEIRLKTGTKEKIKKEAIQVAAMAIRLVKDCCSDNW